MTIPEQVFKAYDIRGLAPEELGTDFAFRLGQAVVHYTQARTVVVGQDMRVTTPRLAAALIQGVLKSGADIIEVGLTTAPMFYFAVADLEALAPSFRGPMAGVMVTASHNPARYNGFKLVRADLLPIGGEEMPAIRKLMEQIPDYGQSSGRTRKIDIQGPYLKRIKSLVSETDFRGQGLKLVVDTGNGMAGLVARDFYQALGLEPVVLNEELDGSFPHHEANPTKEENLVDLKEAVRREQADLGLAYDGDADRIVFVDEKGRAVRSDLLGALLAREILKQYPGSPILYDLRCSWALGEEIIKFGGQPRVTPVGYVFIKPLLRQFNAALAIELSGHFYFKDFWGVDAPDLAAWLVLRRLIQTGVRFSELIEPLDRYAHSGEINFEVLDKNAIMSKIRNKYGPGQPPVDPGWIRADFPDWWFLLRPSNTEPVLRLNLEAKTPALMKEKLHEISSQLVN